MRPSDIRQELPPLLRLALPLIAGELGWMSMSVVDTSMVGRLPHAAVPMAAAALALLLVCIFAFGPTILSHMPVDHTVLAQAIPALYGLNWGVIPLLLYFTLRRYLQAAHHAKPIAFALVSANLINFIGDWLLIYGHSWHFGAHTLTIPAYQVVGSAWATSFARLYLMVVLLVAILRADRRHQYGLLTTSRRIELQHLRRLFRLGAPAGAQIFVEIAVFA